MASRLPDLARLAEDIRACTWARNQTVGGAVGFLVERRGELAAYADLDVLVTRGSGNASDPAAHALVINLGAVRNVIVDRLWRQDLFVGLELVAELLFQVVADPNVDDPVLALLELLCDEQVTQPGLVLFPLHSIRLRRDALPGSPAEYVQPAWGIALSAQANDLDDTIAFLDRARVALGVRKPVDPSALEHWHRTGLGWLKTNPMLAIRMTAQRGSLWDTEAIVLSRVRAATAQLAMVASVQRASAAAPSPWPDSSKTNNYETLDIHHYLAFVDLPARPDALAGECVPIKSRTARIAELSDLGIDLDPAFRGDEAVWARIDAAISIVFRGHVAHLWRISTDTRTRTCDRLFTALSFFLRSFQGGAKSWSAAVSLATAFELLLTDSYSRNVAARLRRRLGLVLDGVAGKAAYLEAFAELYRARGDLVHAGTDATGVDLGLAQEAFVHAFCAIVPRLADLPVRADAPMLLLTGDAPAA